MFEDMDRTDQQLVFVGLKALLETGRNRGMVFYNADPGHPVYHDGAQGRDASSTKETDRVFQMLSELSAVFKKDGDTEWVWWYDFSEWTDFCKFVLQEYYRRHDEEQS